MSKSEYLLQFTPNIFLHNFLHFISKLFNIIIIVSLYHEHWNRANEKQMSVILRMRLLALHPELQQPVVKKTCSQQSVARGEERRSFRLRGGQENVA